MSSHVRSNNITALRGAALAGVIALLIGVIDWVTDAWVADYGLDISIMVLISLGYGIFAAAGYFARTSIEVVFEEERLRFRTGMELLTNKWKSVPYDMIHTGTLVQSKSILAQVSATITLHYRAPQRKMMAVPLHLPLAHIDDPVSFFDELAKRIDVTWKEGKGEFDSGERKKLSDVRHSIEFMRIAHAPSKRNETDPPLVIDEETGSENRKGSPSVTSKDVRELS